MSTPQRVLIIGDTSLFTAGLTAWLTCETRCQVSTICYDDGALLQHALISTHPDVIVLTALFRSNRRGCSISSRRRQD